MVSMALKQNNDFINKISTRFSRKFSFDSLKNKNKISVLEFSDEGNSNSNDSTEEEEEFDPSTDDESAQPTGEHLFIQNFESFPFSKNNIKFNQQILSSFNVKVLHQCHFNFFSTPKIYMLKKKHISMFIKPTRPPPFTAGPRI